MSDAYLGLNQRHAVEVPGSGAPAELHDPSRQSVGNAGSDEPEAAAVPLGPADVDGQPHHQSTGGGSISSAAARQQGSQEQAGGVAVRYGSECT